ncbi:MAG: ABC-F type ribosomal protection protein [Oscillospiraceae bacterium]|nr:ABC-F type ribosomal protection protein [Oscillospiraceae bacterium]
MSLINVSHLSFSYDGSGDMVFDDVSFQIDTAWRLGFCGRNGRGKTTFLKLLMGEYEYRGTIAAGVDFAYFPFPAKDESLDALEIISSIAPETAPWQAQRELSKLAVRENALCRPFATLSNGERTKVLLAALFLCENRFLLIDEPTNHLDLEARTIVARYLNGKAGFILVSHDRAFLDACTDHTLSINRASIEVVSGSFSSWQAQKQRQDAFELAQNERLSHEIDRLRKTAEQTARWSDKVERSKKQPLASGLSADRGYIGHKSAKMMKRAKATEHRQRQAIDDKSKLLKNIESSDALKIWPQAYHSDVLISLDKVSVFYDKHSVFRDLSFALRQGERIALRGGNGSGKSSVLKLLCGEEISHTGRVQIGSRLRISYIPQDASFLAGSLNDYAREQQIDEALFKTILRKLDFSREQFEKNMRDYSAGQKKKILLARSLSQRAHAYLWDEPLNYVDLLSRIQIEELILAYRPTLLFVEHDRAFCENIATQVIQL